MISTRRGMMCVEKPCQEAMEALEKVKIDFGKGMRDLCEIMENRILSTAQHSRLNAEKRAPMLDRVRKVVVPEKGSA